MLYENGTEVARRVNCISVICQYDTNIMDVGSDEKEDSDDEPSIIENVFEAIVDAVSEMITEIFAETRTDDSEVRQNDSEAKETRESYN